LPLGYSLLSFSGLRDDDVFFPPSEEEGGFLLSDMRSALGPLSAVTEQLPLLLAADRDEALKIEGSSPLFPGSEYPLYFLGLHLLSLLCSN